MVQIKKGTANISQYKVGNNVKFACSWKGRIELLAFKKRVQGERWSEDVHTRTLATCLQNLFPKIFAPYKQYFTGERFVFLKIVLNSISVNILTLVRSFVIGGFCLGTSWCSALPFPVDKLKFLKNTPLNYSTLNPLSTNMMSQAVI